MGTIGLCFRQNKRAVSRRPSKATRRTSGALFLRAAGSAGRLAAFAAGFGCQLTILRKRPLLCRHAATAFAGDLPLPLLVHRREAAVRGGTAFRHELPPSQSETRTTTLGFDGSGQGWVFWG